MLLLDYLFLVSEKTSLLSDKIFIKKFGISKRNYLILKAVYFWKKIKVSDLKSLFMTSYQSFSQNIKGLIDQGYISRTKEGRVHYISLTNEWTSLFNKIEKYLKEELSPELMSNFSNNETQEFKRLLNKMSNELNYLINKD